MPERGERCVAPDIWVWPERCGGDPTVGRSRLRVQTVAEDLSDLTPSQVEAGYRVPAERVVRARAFWAGVTWARRTSTAETTLARVRAALQEDEAEDD